MISCEIIRDMLPLYRDRCASSQTKRLIAAHLKDCSDCKNYYKTAISHKKQYPITAESTSVNFKKIANKMKKTRFIKCAAAGACISLVVGAVYLVLNDNGDKLF